MSIHVKSHNETEVSRLYDGSIPSENKGYSDSTLSHDYLFKARQSNVYWIMDFHNSTEMMQRWVYVWCLVRRGAKGTSHFQQNM